MNEIDRSKTLMINANFDITHNWSWCSFITGAVLMVWIPQVACMTTCSATTSATACFALFRHGPFIATKRPTFWPHPSPKRLFLITATSGNWLSAHDIRRLLQVIWALCRRQSIKRIVINTGETIKVTSSRFTSWCQTRWRWRRIVVAATDVSIHLLPIKRFLQAFWFSRKQNQTNTTSSTTAM